MREVLAVKNGLIFEKVSPEEGGQVADLLRLIHRRNGDNTARVICVNACVPTDVLRDSIFDFLCDGNLRLEHCNFFHGHAKNNAVRRVDDKAFGSSKDQHMAPGTRVIEVFIMSRNLTELDPTEQLSGPSMHVLDRDRSPEAIIRDGLSPHCNQTTDVEKSDGYNTTCMPDGSFEQYLAISQVDNGDVAPAMLAERVLGPVVGKKRGNYMMSNKPRATRKDKGLKRQNGYKKRKTSTKQRATRKDKGTTRKKYKVKAPCVICGKVKRFCKCTKFGVATQMKENLQNFFGAAK